MLIDARAVPAGSTLDTDVLIIGAGPAGLAIARELIGEACDVIVLTGGEDEYRIGRDNARQLALGHLRGAQSLARGERTGQPYFPLSLTRVRAYGGTLSALKSHGLRSRRFDPIDFEPLTARGGIGWPYALEELEPYYERARAICALPETQAPAPDPGSLAVGRVRDIVFEYGGDRAVRELYGELERSEQIRVVRHGSATDLRNPAAGQPVDQVFVTSLDGPTFSVRPRLVVVAAGGIENARLLLLSRSTQPEGLGNQDDLVGRFFMEHLHMTAGFVEPTGPVGPLLERYGHHTEEYSLAITNEAMREAGILNSVFTVTAARSDYLAPSVRASAHLRGTLKHGIVTRQQARYAARVLTAPGQFVSRVRRKFAPGQPPDLIELGVMSEQLPNPDSRVTLGRSRDRLGQQRARLDWRVSAADVDSLSETVRIADEDWRQAGLGRFVLRFDEEQPKPLYRGGWHHMGTTRMHRDPSQGVVDPDTRLHAAPNVFVAGSSVFPTGGFANPTFTLAAVAIRTADTIKRDLGLPVGS